MATAIGVELRPGMTVVANSGRELITRVFHLRTDVVTQFCWLREQ
jgi:hypothetical protein